MGRGRARRCENGAFGTEIVRGIRQLKSLGLKHPKNRKIARPDFFDFSIFSDFSGFSLYTPPPYHPPKAANIKIIRLGPWVCRAHGFVGPMFAGLDLAACGEHWQRKACLDLAACGEAERVLRVANCELPLRVWPF